eukprot:8499081-Pyramimonas_sp.AAC.1
MALQRRLSGPPRGSEGLGGKAPRSSLLTGWARLGPSGPSGSSGTARHHSRACERTAKRCARALLTWASATGC